MKPHDIDDPIEALRAELQRVSPPTGYVARLRQRIDAEGDAPARLVWWKWALPLGAVAVVVLAITINRHERQAPVVTTVQVEQPPVVPVLTPSPAPQPVRPSVTRVARGPALANRVVQANAPKSDIEPMPEIITNQAEVLRSLWARTERRAILVESTKPAPDPAAEIVVAPIEILPIVIAPLTDAGKAGSLPIVRPPNRDSSERRAK